MPASYRRAPRPLVLAHAERSDESRGQPSDNDFTVLLQREQREGPRVAVVASAAREGVVPHVRTERRPRQAPPLPRDADQTGPATVASLAPPPPTTVSVAPPPPVVRPQARRGRQALVAGALAFLSFGCLAGIGVELALREWGHGSRSPAAAMVPGTVVVPAVPPTAMVTTSATVSSSNPAQAATGAVAPPLTAETAGPRWATATSLDVTSSLTASAGARPIHHRRKHHHAVHPQVLAHAVPPPAPAPPAAPDPALADYPLSSDPPVAATPPAVVGAQPDEMAAAQQMLTQAKAELSL
jgi:hypothetical protein